MLSRTGLDLVQVKAIRGAIASLVLVDATHASLKKSHRPQVISTRGMRQTDAQLGQTLPKVAFVVRASLPASFQDLMSGERTTFTQQPSRHLD